MGPTELVRYFYEVIVSENLAHRIPEFVSPACRARIGDQWTCIGAEGMADHITATKSTYPDYVMKITRQFCDGEYVVSEFLMEGTHRGAWLGIEPSGKRLRFTGINIDRVAEGKILEHAGAVNTLETLLEAGMIGPARREGVGGEAPDDPGAPSPRGEG